MISEKQLKQEIKAIDKFLKWVSKDSKRIKDWGAV